MQKSDISQGPFTKVIYQMKCMDPLHASFTDNHSDPNKTSKLLVQTVRHTKGIGWFFNP